MSITHRVKRLLGISLAGAMVLSLMPAGIAAAQTIETDDVEACDLEGFETPEFNDSLGFFASQIECMASYGITLGDAEGNYNSTGTVTRQQMALFIARLASQALNGNITDIPESTDDAFDDIADINPPEARDAINWLAELNITVGASGGDSYNPSGPVTRQQMASFIARAHLALEVDFDGLEIDDERFTDVDEDNVHFDNINTLAAAGVVEGTGDGTTYSPAAPVTRGQMSAFIVRSIGVLESQDLWNGVPTADPIEVPTNQTFAVDSDDTQVPAGADVAFTADVGDAEEVTIWVLDADDVNVDNGTVTFEADDDGDFDAGLADGGTVITDIDGVAVPASQSRTVTGIDGGIEFTINSANPDQYVVLVAATEDGDAPELDEDGAPVEDFGVSDTINVQNVEGVGLLDADREDTIFGVPSTSVRPEGETVNVLAALIDNADPTDDDAEVVATGGELSYVVADNDGGTYSPGDAPGSVTGADTIASGTATVTDGVASFAFEGGEDGDVYIILAEWEGVDAYEDESETTFAAADHGEIEFAEDDGLATMGDWVDDSDVFAPTGGTARVSAEVTDQFGNGIAGIVVDFDVDGDAFARTTNSDGVATLAYSNDDNEDNTVTASVAAAGQDDVDADFDIDAGGSVTVFWYDDAAADVDGEVLYLISDNEVVVDDTISSEYLLVEIESGQLYQVNGGSVTETAFFNTLEDEADKDFDGAVNTQLVTTDYDDDDETTVYNLVEAT